MKVRIPNTFEKILLLIGFLIVVIGYAMIFRVLQMERAMSWSFVSTVFLWLVLIGIIIMIATMENVKEEMKIVIDNQLYEIRMLREEMKPHKKK